MAFPTTLDSDFGTIVDSSDYPQAAHVNTLRRAVEGLEAKMGIDSSAVTTSIDYKVNNFFVTNRMIYLYENTAPTGWSIHTPTDCVLAVKGGSDAYNRTGGGLAGSFSTVHTHTVTVPLDGWSQGFITTNRLGAAYNAASFNYGITASRVLTSGSGGSSSYRPYAAVGIIVKKT